MSLIDKLKKLSDDAVILTDSKYFDKSEMIPTDVPIINMAASAEIDGGIGPGILQIVGQSKHFKTGFSLLMIKAFQTKKPKGVTIFFDSEFGAPPDYFNSFGINTDAILHDPITDVEDLKFKIMKYLENIERNDPVMIMIDSIGNLASKKEVEDALNEKSVADMTRAKALKSVARMITPHLTLKNIPLVAINHIYKDVGSFIQKDIVGGGQGWYLASNAIWKVTRKQGEKDEDKNLLGYEFTINIEKSRYVKEKSQFTVKVNFDNGIDRTSGLLENALEAKILRKGKKGKETAYFEGENEVPDTSLVDPSYWAGLFKRTELASYLTGKYKLSKGDFVKTIEGEDIVNTDSN